VKNLNTNDTPRDPREEEKKEVKNKGLQMTLIPSLIRRE
jgi:phospholipase A2